MHFAVAMDDRNPAMIAVPHDGRILVVCVVRTPTVMVVNTDAYTDRTGADINTLCTGRHRRQSDGRRRQASDCNVPHLGSPHFVSHA
jgi:hypothetical protein